MKAVIVDCFKSETLRYVFLRYVTYAIQFVITILLAKKLGENSFGIYSFILLFQQYASYANLGVNESLNVEYAKYYSKSEVLSHSIWGASWLISTFLSVLLILIGYVFFLIFSGTFMIDSAADKKRIERKMKCVAAFMGFREE